jgi:hypothetical protein
MNLIVKYNLHEVGRAAGCEHWSVGHIYTLPPFVQMSHGLGDILVGLWHVIWNIVMNLEEESMRTGGRILADIAEKAPGTSTLDIISRHVPESTQNLVKKLR